PAEPKPEPAATSEEPKQEEPDPKKPAESSSGESAWDETWHALAEIELGSPTEADQTQPQPVAAEQPSEEEKKEPESDRSEEPAADSLAPVYVVLGEGTVTIVSDDPVALDQFEQLLRAILPSAGTIGRNISIFELKHASAAVVAEKLEDLFDTNIFSWRRGGGSVVIVPDERLNTILVQGNRIDRETVEGLLRVLDSDEVPEALAAQKPKLLPIENVDAEQIAEVIRAVFKTQLSPPARTRNGRTSAPTPLVTPQIAVDEGTNSLVVTAAAPLLDEIIELATTLDEAAGKTPARRVRIIPLEKTDAGRVQRALEQILKNPSSRRSR
ncbi:MAG: secretin N-terminal domain-containing protein, partial [Planctomycetota bacterium]